MTDIRGHTYRDNRTGAKVMAMEGFRGVRMLRVREVNDGDKWLGREYVAHADWLTPLPMAYFHGQVPDHK